MDLRLALTLLIAVVVAAPAPAQIFRREAGPPKGTPPAEAEIWPFPAPDPKSWWDDKRPRTDEAADPLGGRRVRRGERLPEPDNGVDASTYRLWGLMPLQWQVLHGDEMILEVWTRPSNSVRQTVTRVVVRDDGAVFVEGRAGLACCEAGIARRMGFDAQLPAGSAGRFQALKALPLWRSPRDVQAEEKGAAAGICVSGSGYDITLAVPGRTATVHRACDAAQIGEAADVLEAVLGAARGHDGRFDVLFPGGASFASERDAYRELMAGGGRLIPNPEAHRPRPGEEPKPLREAEPATPGRPSGPAHPG